jgi:hypothetical protein
MRRRLLAKSTNVKSNPTCKRAQAQNVCNGLSQEALVTAGQGMSMKQ